MNEKSLHYSDLILYNGKIRTMAPAQAVHGAVGCSGGRIVALGQSAEVQRLAGPDTRMIDLEGRTALPGLTDAHVHLAEKGTEEKELVDCRDFYTDVQSIAEILERMAKRARELPAGAWLVAHGSPMQDFRLKDKKFPDKHDLDRAVPDYPACISFGAHITIANSKALALANISPTTADPAGGAILRDDTTGEPTGQLFCRWRPAHSPMGNSQFPPLRTMPSPNHVMELLELMLPQQICRLCKVRALANEGLSNELPAPY
jgi:predicted amidohydrolase YtcJ